MRILITAGPTREPLDPVRFISNYSTGAMGYELARVGILHNHNVTLISGPSCFLPPKEARFFKVETALQMYRKLRAEFDGCDCLIMNSAVCDYRPIRCHATKLKSTRKMMQLTLTKNPDILSSIAGKKNERLIIGFAIDTESLQHNALKKLRQKNLDLIVGTLLTKSALPFGEGKPTAVLINKSGRIERFSRISKNKLAHIIIKRAEELFEKRRTKRLKTIEHELHKLN